MEMDDLDITQCKMSNKVLLEFSIDRPRTNRMLREGQEIEGERLDDTRDGERPTIEIGYSTWSTSRGPPLRRKDDDD